MRGPSGLAAGCGWDGWQGGRKKQEPGLSSEEGFLALAAGRRCSENVQRRGVTAHHMEVCNQEGCVRIMR
eukprot:1161835-Pelagomonas_calceolata.AAC.15